MTPPPAFFAAVSACATKGRACCARVDLMRPGRWNSAVTGHDAIPRTVQKGPENQEDGREAHGARQRRTVRNAPKI